MALGFSDLANLRAAILPCCHFSNASSECFKSDLPRRLASSVILNIIKHNQEEREKLIDCVYFFAWGEDVNRLVDDTLCSHRIHLRHSHRLRQLFYSPALTEDSPTCSLSTLSYFFSTTSMPRAHRADSPAVALLSVPPHSWMSLPPHRMLMLIYNTFSPLEFHSLILKKAYAWVLFSTTPTQAYH